MARVDSIQFAVHRGYPVFMWSGINMKHEYIETHLAKHEYIEGPQALANFNRVATAVFHSKKTVAPPKAQATKKRVSRRKSGKDKA
jgi:hypothetical protein